MRSSLQMHIIHQELSRCILPPRGIEGFADSLLLFVILRISLCNGLQPTAFWSTPVAVTIPDPDPKLEFTGLVGTETDDPLLVEPELPHA
ncbi:hypothetical protein BGZ70_009486 [Mortierella alpina]|uniref:Uncharacterized protein n=1 Tax=Mortierella alpina TaxID=64518 RepID=A0A9P6J1T9_MORAP|nr:hypothetical protein BGZ70_009486 [Mortierella alpina]